MKQFKHALIITLTFAFAGGLTEILQAQTSRTDAINAYNSAENAAASGEYESALSAYEAALDVANSCGAECEDLVETIESRIPEVAYANAVGAYNQFQGSNTLANINATIEAFSDAAQVSTEYGNAQYAQNSQGVLPQLYYAKGVIQHMQEDYEGELESLDQAIELNSNYAFPYYQKALAYNALDAGYQTVIDWLRQAIEVAERTESNDVLQRAQNRLVSELVYRADQRKQANQLTQAIELLQEALELNPNHVEANYRMAEASNMRGEVDAALTHAQRALENESGGNAVMAKFYYEMGLAYQAMGSTMKQEACSAFSNAAYGEFSESSNHKMEFELNCDA